MNGKAGERSTTVAWGVASLLVGAFVVVTWAPLPALVRGTADDVLLGFAVALAAVAAYLSARVSRGWDRRIWLLTFLPIASYASALVLREVVPARFSAVSAAHGAMVSGLLALTFAVPGVALIAESRGRAMLSRVLGTLDYLLIMTTLLVMAHYATLEPVRAGNFDPVFVAEVAVVVLPTATLALIVWSLVVRRGSWAAWRGALAGAVAASGAAVAVIQLSAWLELPQVLPTADAVGDFLVHLAFLLTAIAGVYRVGEASGDAEPATDDESTQPRGRRTNFASALALLAIPVVAYLAFAAHGPTEHAFAVTAAGTLAVLLLARGAVIGLDNRILQAQRMLDPFTGLFSERRFDFALAREVSLAIDREEPVALCVLRASAPASGYRPARAVRGSDLRRIAAAIDALKGATGIGARSGENLLLLLPGMDADAARAVCERVVEQVARSFGNVEEDIPAIAVGVAGCPEHATSAEELLRLARGAAYWALTFGGQQVIVYDPSLVEALDIRDHLTQLQGRARTRTVEALAATVDARDSYTRDHSQNVSEWAAALAAEIGVEAGHAELVRTAGLLHDIGKVSVPDHILLKDGRLTADERRTIQGHSAAGERILKGAVSQEMLAWVRAHHERWDGTGYPDGLVGPDIPLEGRILAVCDAFDAMTSNRAYRQALERAEALDELRSCAGTQFDPALVEAFARVLAAGATPVPVTSAQDPDLVRMLHPTLPSAVAEVMPDHTYSTFRAVNAVSREVLGFTAEEITSMTPEELLNLPAETRHTGPVRMLVAALRSGDHPVSERDLKTKAGPTLRAELFPSLIERDGRTYIVYTMRPLYADATARRAVERRVRQLERLAAVTRRLNEGLPARGVAEVGLDAAMSLLDARQAGIGLLDAGGIEFRYRSRDGADVEGVRFREVPEPYAAVMADGPLVSNALAADALASGVDGIETPFDAVVVPIVARDGAAVGVLEVHNAPRAFTGDDTALLEGIAAAVAIAIENAESRREIEAREAVLLEQGAALRQLTAQLAATEERERRAIAADLHDRIGQSLQISKLLVAQAQAEDDAGQMRESLGKADELLAQAIQDTRSLMFEISPPVLYDLGLEAAFEWLTENVVTSAKVSFHDDGASKPLDDTVRALVFRMGRELVINAIKHAGADSIEISTSRLGGSLVLEVRDDGRGFDAERAPEGRFGLQNLRAQVAALSGSVEFLTRPEGGTVVRLSVPLARS